MRRLSSLLVALPLLMAALLIGCGGDAPAAGDSRSEDADNAEEVAARAVVDQIIAAFDALVDEAQAALKDKPKGADVLPKLEALLSRYRSRMETLRDQRAATTNAFARRSANGYLTERRGEAVRRRDERLARLIAHYRNIDGTTDVADLLQRGLIEVLNIAAQ